MILPLIKISHVSIPTLRKAPNSLAQEHRFEMCLHCSPYSIPASGARGKEARIKSCIVHFFFPVARKLPASELTRRVQTPLIKEGRVLSWAFLCPFCEYGKSISAAAYAVG